jgi:hypothetical protein
MELDGRAGGYFARLLVHSAQFEERDGKSSSGPTHATLLIEQILESTNSLISLLAEICDPVYLLGLLRASLDRYIAIHAVTPEVGANGNRAEISTLHGVKAQASGYLFGLNGMGMCILRLPAPVIEVEAPKLASVVTKVSPAAPLYLYLRM